MSEPYDLSEYDEKYPNHKIMVLFKGNTTWTALAYEIKTRKIITQTDALPSPAEAVKAVTAILDDIYSRLS